MNKNTSLFLCGAIVPLLLSATTLPATAQVGCDDRLQGETIRWIVPSSPGGGYDTYSRLIAPYYEKHTGAEVVVHNRPGAGGQIGATQIMQADADGLTVGILNGPGLMAASLYEDRPIPNPATDFTILGRVAATRRMWAIGVNSSLPPLKQIIDQGQDRPIVFGTRGPGTSSFVDIVLASNILKLDVDIITGFQGSQDGILGILRGDIDAVAHSWSSLRGALDNGEIKPWLQIAAEPIAGGVRYDAQSLLAGPQGLAARAAWRDGEDPAPAAERAAALVELTTAGRLIAAPPDLEPGLRRCLRDTLHAALTDPDFAADAAQAGRPLDIARGEAAAARLEAVQPALAGFAPVLRAASDAYGK